MIGIDRAVVDELADAAALDDGVVVALDDLGFVDELAGFGVVPARRGVVFPFHQSGGPRQLQHPGRRQLVVDLHLEARARRAVRPELRTADDHHQIRRVDVEVLPARRKRGGVPARRGRQRRDDVARCGPGCRLARLLTRLCGQLGHVEVDVTEPAGEVDLQRFAGCGHL